MIDEQELRGWIGRCEDRGDIVTPAVVDRLAALLDHDDPPWRSGELPPLGHWLCHLPDARKSQIGHDGHPKRGGFLPPVQLPRRMWAGSRIQFVAPIPLGAAITRRSTIADLKVKGSPGRELVLVTIRHDIRHSGIVAITEEQDLVYVGNRGRPSKPDTPSERPADVSRRLTADPVLLFRYSALTFNAHRIHYDRSYAMGEEGYPGLVVHGPLLATLLMDHFLRSRPAAQVSRFAFRAVAPLFDGEAFDLNMSGTAAGAELWTSGPRGETMTAKVEV